MTGHRAAAPVAPSEPTTEKQTITITNWVENFNEWTFFVLQWDNAVPPDHPVVAVFPWAPPVASDPESVAADVQASINGALDNAPAPWGITPSDYYVTVTGEMNGGWLVLTIEFTGPGYAGRNIALGTASDWGDCDMPIIGPVQDGG